MLTPIRLSPFLLAYGLSASTASFLAPTVQQHHVLKEGSRTRPRSTHTDGSVYRGAGGAQFNVLTGNPDAHKTRPYETTFEGELTKEKAKFGFFNKQAGDLTLSEAVKLDQLEMEAGRYLPDHTPMTHGVLEGSGKPKKDKK